MKLVAVLVTVILMLGVTPGSTAPADSLVHNCTYGQLVVYSQPGNDVFLSISNQTGGTAAIRYRLYRSTNPTHVDQTWLNVSQGANRYINLTGYYIVVEYKRNGWPTWKYGCERFG